MPVPEDTTSLLQAAEIPALHPMVPTSAPSPIYVVAAMNVLSWVTALGTNEIHSLEMKFRLKIHYPVVW